MGMNFSCNVLEFPKERLDNNFRQPNWDAAILYIKTLTEKELLSVISNDDIDYNETDDLTSLFTNAIIMCKEMWDGKSRFGSSIVLSGTLALVGGGSTWGDEPEGCRAIRLFSESGAAKAAGFLVWF